MASNRRATVPDPLDLKYLGELETHRGYHYVVDHILREMNRKTLELRKCKPRELRDLQGFVRGIEFCVNSLAQCKKTLTEELTKRGLEEER